MAGGNQAAGRLVDAVGADVGGPAVQARDPGPESQNPLRVDRPAAGVHPALSHSGAVGPPDLLLEPDDPPVDLVEGLRVLDPGDLRAGGVGDHHQLLGTDPQIHPHHRARAARAGPGARAR